MKQLTILLRVQFFFLSCMTLPLFAGGDVVSLSPRNCAKAGVLVRTRLESPGTVTFEVILTPRSTPLPMQWEVLLDVAEGTNSVARCSLVKRGYSPLFSADAILQPRRLIEELARAEKPISSHIWTNMPTEVQASLLDPHSPLELCQITLAEELNRVVMSGSVEQAIKDGSKFVAFKALAPHFREGVVTKTMCQNRFLLESNYKMLLLNSRNTMPEPLRSLPEADKYQSYVVEFEVSDKFVPSSTLYLTKGYGEIPSFFSWNLALKDFAPR